MTAPLTIDRLAERGVQVMLWLAARHPRRLVALAEIAAAQGISTTYAECLIGWLRRGGLLRSVVGRRGGFQLAAPAEQITVAQVLQALPGRERRGPANAAAAGALERHLDAALWQYLGGLSLAQCVAGTAGRLSRQAPPRHAVIGRADRGVVGAVAGR